MYGGPGEVILPRVAPKVRVIRAHTSARLNRDIVEHDVVNGTLKLWLESQTKVLQIGL